MEVINYPLEEEYEEVEYLDEEFEEISDVALEATILNTSIPLKRNPLSLEALNPESPSLQHPEIIEKRKWPKKKKKSERTKLYKQYCHEDLQKAVHEVRNGNMPLAKASEKYGVPKKTLIVKAHNFDDKDDKSTEKHRRFIQEIKTLLQYTTAVPFKTKTTRYYCFYCSDRPHFEDTEELRTHTLTEHENEWRRLHIYMRPQWVNEIIKFDVEDLYCKVCSTLIIDWNNLFVHLAVAHNLEFDLAYTNVIPYALNDQLKCFLCHQSFNNYGHLDSHMNGHYSNYLCHTCGDTFLSACRLDKHLLVHKIGEYFCDTCGKAFTLQKYRSKHIKLVHIQKNSIKCLYCPKSFVGLFQRHVHVTEKHKEKVKIMTCEYCGNSYTWKPYFLTHMRRRHTAVKKHECSVCKKCFLDKYELKNHMVRHTGEKNFVCALCGEQFARMVTLKKHTEMHYEYGF